MTLTIVMWRIGGFALCIAIAVICRFAWRRHNNLWAGFGVSNMANRQFNYLVVDRIVETRDRLKRAKDALEASSVKLKDATEQKAANPTNAELQAAFDRSQAVVDSDKQVLEFEQLQLDRLLNSGGGSQIDWGLVLQYAIFASLALFVLVHLMSGITSSPPPGTTPRSMITLLIAVVTVGIALILVLATIVSDGPDREKRFQQGKEVLTSLLGVLGTIVGFYFGATHDQVKDLEFDPVTVQTSGEIPQEFRTSIRGGTAPYIIEVTFTPVGVVKPLTPPKQTSADGVVAFKIDLIPEVKLEKDTSITVTIVVTDSAGLKGRAEYKDVLKFKKSPSSPH